MVTAEGLREPEPPNKNYRAAIARIYQGSTVVGAGFRVSEQYLLTCAHVVSQCLTGQIKFEGIAVKGLTNKTLEVDFPVDQSRQRQVVKVISELWRSNNEDIAVLKLTNPLPDEVKIITVEQSDSYWHHPFSVFGFPARRPDGISVNGEMLGEQPGTGWIQMQGNEEGLSIRPGFSGSPVWDERLGSVVGMIVARDTEESARIGFMIPYQKLKPALEAIALFDLLLPASDRLETHWRNAYRLLRSDISTEDYPKTLEAAILQVLDMPNRDGPYQPIEQFIGYFARPEWQLDIQVRLVQWLTQRAIDVPALLDAIRQKRPAQPTAATTPHLLFWVQAEHNSDRYFVQAYLVEDRERYEPQQANQLTAPAKWLEQSQNEKVDCTQIEQMLRECLEECVEQLTSGKGIPNLQVVVFLPLTCLGWDVDRWAADEPDPDLNPDPEPMGSRYGVVLRSAERLSNPKLCKPQSKALWHDKWQALTNPTSPAHPRLVSGDDETPQTLPQKLRPPDVVGFFLTRSNPALFPVLCGSGAPVAIWLRQDLPNQCQQHFTQLLTGNLASLPTRIRELRNRLDAQCPEAELHLKQHLSLIWEDPRLVPPTPGQAPRLGMTA